MSEIWRFSLLQNLLNLQLKERTRYTICPLMSINVSICSFQNFLILILYLSSLIGKYRQPKNIRKFTGFTVERGYHWPWMWRSSLGRLRVQPRRPRLRARWTWTLVRAWPHRGSRARSARSRRTWSHWRRAGWWRKLCELWAWKQHNWKNN